MKLPKEAVAVTIILWGSATTTLLSSRFIVWELTLAVILAYLATASVTTGVFGKRIERLSDYLPFLHLPPAFLVFFVAYRYALVAPYLSVAISITAYTLLGASIAATIHLLSYIYMYRKEGKKSVGKETVKITGTIKP